jgi:hypothetical protein
VLVFEHQPTSLAAIDFFPWESTVERAEQATGRASR